MKKTKFEYNFLIVDSTGKIITGNEYKSDAQDELKTGDYVDCKIMSVKKVDKIKLAEFMQHNGYFFETKKSDTVKSILKAIKAAGIKPSDVNLKVESNKIIFSDCKIEWSGNDIKASELKAKHITGKKAGKLFASYDIDNGTDSLFIDFILVDGLVLKTEVERKGAF